METIFDHNPTKEELDEMFGTGGGSIWKDKEHYLKFADKSKSYANLYLLYLIRNKGSKAMEFLHKIDNPIYRRDIRMTYERGTL